MSKYQVVIGRAEPIDIVGVALAVPAKVDTGAFRSSIHVSKAKVVKHGGKEVLQFDILGHKCAPVPRTITVDTFDQLKVRSSNGSLSKRYVVTLKVKVGPKVFNTSFTLADRSDNVFPILIGRDALSGRFIVDSAKANVTRHKLAKEYGISVDSAEDEE
jgi:hypothetical protein